MFFLGDLPYKATQQQYNVHFLCTDNESTSVEMAEGIADQLNQHCGDGFLAFDAHAMEEVFVIPCFVLVILDNPMGNSLSGVMVGGAPRHPCRICHVDSTKETPEALLKWFQVGASLSLVSCDPVCSGHR